MALEVADRLLLDRIATLLTADTSSSLLLAAEIEFYLPSSDPSLLSALHLACQALPFSVSDIEKEKGLHQYELQLTPFADAVSLAEAIVTVRETLSVTAEALEASVSFLSKPYPEEPGSSIHIHVNLFDNEGNNCFQKDGENDPALLLYAIGGLCATMREAMPVFAPLPEAYGRFVRHLNAPTTISWGGNNRTTALRIPTSPPENRRIEYRIAGAESNPYLVIAAILAGIHYGITHHIPAPAKIYGDASHPQYGLEPLPLTLEEAWQAYEEGEVLKKYLGF